MNVNRIIFIAEINGRNGGGIVTKRNLQYLSRTAKKVICIPANKINSTLLERILGSGLNASFSAIRALFYLRLRGGPIDLIWIDRSNLWVYVVLSRLLFPQSKLAVFFHNNETKYAKEALVCHRSRIYGVFHSYMGRVLIFLFRPNCIFFSFREFSQTLIKRKYFFPFSGKIPDTKYFESAEENKGLIFVGSDFYPNIHGLQWYGKHVAPFVDEPLCAVGQGLEISAGKINGICYMGYVENLSELYVKYSYAVIPIFKGGGTKVKAVEALMYGLTIFVPDEIYEDLSFLGDNLQNKIIKFSSSVELISLINARVEKKVSTPTQSFFDERRYFSLDSLWP